MCLGRAWPKLRRVKTDTIEITLKLRRDEGTVSGRASSPGREDREFAGWIGLMGLVDSMLDGAGTEARAVNPDHLEGTVNAD